MTKRLSPMHLRIVTAFFVVTCGLGLQTVHAQQQPTSQPVEPFSEAVAQRLMVLVRDGLVSQDADMMLSAFGGMRDYREFADAVRTFFSLHENFRVYYRIIEVAPVDCAESGHNRKVECGRAVVEMQLQADDAHNTVPGLTRNGQLHISFVQLKEGWRISDIDREFFN